MSNLNDSILGFDHEGTNGLGHIMLNGKTALVVEEEFLIALDIQQMLEGLGAGQTLFARTASEAEQLRSNWRDIAVAIVELSSNLSATLHLIELLELEGIPTVMTTADLTVHPALAGRHQPLVAKPIPETILASAVQHALANRSK